MCICRYLTDIEFHEVARTFDEAFADYYVKMAKSSELWLKNRAAKNGVAMDCSVGAFAGDKMVGFTLVGLDTWLGRSAAFDAATGIVPDYRGKGLARKMFDHILPRLRERGVKLFLLEVLQPNEPAIKAYSRAGFKINRDFDCYNLKPDKIGLDLTAGSSFDIRPIGKGELAQFEAHTDWQPSWENSFSSLQRIPDEITAFGCFIDGECVGEIVYYPLIKWLMSLVVKRDYRRRGVATELLRHFLADLEPGWDSVKLTNVDRSDQATAALLQKSGFEVFISQYEMELAI